MGEIQVMMMPSQSTIAFPLFTAPCSPARIEDYYLSTPASPGQISQFYRELDEFLINNSMTSDVRRNSVCSTVPFDWEEKPGVPKWVAKMNNKNIYEDDFAFDVSQEMDAASLSADELFDGGKIRPRGPHFPAERSPTPQKSAESIIRGRERSVISSLSSSRSGHRSTRSLSPMRVSKYPWEEGHGRQQKNCLEQNSKQPSKPRFTSSVSALSSSSLKGLKKWKLKDFFLFRSASEGRASNKADPIKKYASLFKKREEDGRSSSFRSIDNNSGTWTSSRSKRKGPAVSAHELHYTVNRAVSEDMKKKTFLPYKQGILGRLAFNPAVNAIANGFGFSRKSSFPAQRCV